MKYLLFLTLFLGLAPAQASWFWSTPTNAYIQYAAPDLREEFKSSWAAEAEKSGDARYQNPSFQRMWVYYRTSFYDIAPSRDTMIRRSYRARHPNLDLTMPKPPGYYEYWRANHASFDVLPNPYVSQDQPEPNHNPAVSFTFLFILIFLLGLLCLSLYFIPTFLAIVRKSPQVGAIAAINLLLGWTLVGWTVALVLACWSFPKGERSA